jgi:hypothetical protein
MTAVGYTGGDPNKVDITGDTMTGPLILSGDPSIALGAATKQYADASGGGGGGGGIPATTVTSETSYGITPAVGIGTKYARDDHTHGSMATPTKTTVGLSNVDNTSDVNKPVSTAQATANGVVATNAANALSAHTSATTSVHGIADTSVLATNASVTTAIAGKVTGPVSATDNAVARFDLTTGKLIQNSLVTIEDNGAMVLTPIAGAAYAIGRLVYDGDSQCLTFFNDDANVSMQVGQELWLKVRNVSGSTIANGIPVYISGASAGLPTIAPANANAIATVPAAGLTTETIANNTNGYVTIAGVVNGVDTSALVAGAVLYVGTTAGALVTTAPSSPNFRNRIGSVMSVNATTGQILVTPGAAVLGFGTANQVLGMNAAATAQEHKTIAGTANRLTVTQGVGTVTLDVSATLMALYATLASPTFTGTPTLPTGTVGVTQTAGNSTTALATTAFVTTADNLKAPIASPTFTGVPATPTAAQGTNTTQLASTAYVQTETGLLVPKSLYTAKGTLAVASAASTPAALAVGADTFVLTADSTQTTGVKWAAAAGGGGSSGVGAAVNPLGGRWQPIPLGRAGSNYTPTINRLFLIPLPIGPTARQITGVSFEIATAAGAGGLGRACLFSSLTTWEPNVEVVDWGTKITTVTGALTWTGLTQNVSANTLYWLGFNPTVAAPVMRGVDGYNPYVNLNAVVTGTTSFGMFIMNSVTASTGATPFAYFDVDLAIRGSVQFA